MPITYAVEEGVAMPRFRRRIASKSLRQTAEELGKKLEEINYMFMTDEQLLALNEQFLQHDFYTDILTFDAREVEDEENVLKGDIAISLDRVRDNAKKMGIPYELELFRVMAHGVLHLCALDDHTPEDDQKMRMAEDRALFLLQKELAGRTFIY